MTRESIRAKLKECGLKVTPAREQLLRFLSRQKRPVGVNSIAEFFSETDRATLYRALEKFVACGLVETCDIGHRHVDYRIKDDSHLHYVVCEQCGRTKAVRVSCEPHDLSARARKAASFASVTRHSVTFFGRCADCARPARGK